MLSPTHLNSFIDVVYAGPEAFFTNTILAFPKAPSGSGQYGNAIHETMQWLGLEANHSRKPSAAAALDYFEKRLSAKHLSSAEHSKMLARGKAALNGYLAHHAADLPKRGEHFEVRFKHDGVFCGKARLNGVIDRLILNEKNKTAHVIDYKTGRPAASWDKGKPAHHKFIQQLLCYKLLIEGSRRFAGYTLESAKISFIEPDNEGMFYDLVLEFNDEIIARHKALIDVVWDKIHRLDFPDISSYPPTISGIRSFEQDLIDGRI